MELSVGIAGTVTIVCLVAFGIFVYPWLLARPRGALVVAIMTAALATAFYAFDNPTEPEVATSAVLGLSWALLPVGTALLVGRIRARAGAAGQKRGTEDGREDARG